ncbi:hypothetical protein Lal_00038828 [Lupinus albus]|uniref:Putative aminoacyltransferase, E1 ubiquitin-activating enzyme n=1 Tax=Lupinus albus TaxID=3870 RepID=A0A6A5N4E7_LUPAL|nr:putative aminoacyltransferase, E1 ubiquitin-activating enzyme [Lupinus albus]KAF1882184.1 hypothetical protein Lal_00038828 [Lupinus albus]
MSSSTITETTLQWLQHSDEVAMSMNNNNNNKMSNWYGSSTSVSEIEELKDSSSELYLDETHNHDVPLSTISEENEDTVYVAVGKGDTSMEALSWTLNNLVTPYSMLYLIHVFLQIKHIPSPLGVGMVPKSQVSVEQIENYMAQERSKRREFLQKFIQSCSSSKVKVDTILIESDMIAKALIDLIPILQIRTLVVGANKSQLRKLRSRKGNSIADQILQNGCESCKVSIVCEGKEVSEQTTQFPSTLPIANDDSMSQKEDQQNNASFSCICLTFKPKFK